MIQLGTSAYEGDERDEIESLNAYITILKQENTELKTSMMDSNQKAYAMGWVDGKNGKPPAIKEILTPKDAIVALDDMYVTVSQLIMIYHDVKDEYKAAVHKLKEIEAMIMSLSERYGVQPWERKEMEDIIKYINDTNKEEQ